MDSANATARARGRANIDPRDAGSIHKQGGRGNVGHVKPSGADTSGAIDSRSPSSVQGGEK